MAELIVDLPKLRHNLEVVLALCTRHGVDLLMVAKGCNGYPPVIDVIVESGVRMVGFSRIADRCRRESLSGCRPCFVSLPALGQVEAVARHFCLSLHSELSTIQAMAKAAERVGRPHGIILMVDIGDLREGVLPAEVVGTVQSILAWRSRFLDLCGIGATLGCCSGTLPDEQNLGLLQELALETEQRTGCRFRTVSVGGSVVIPWLEKGLLPPRINQVRIGEAILLGNIPTLEQRHEALSHDVFTLRGTVVEAKVKPSRPPGRQGKDVFGQQLTFSDRGYRARCILDFGILDTYPKGLTPVMPGVEFVNSNSDYTIVDVTETGRTFRPGDTLDYHLSYQALIRAFHASHLRVTLKDGREGVE